MTGAPSSGRLLPAVRTGLAALALLAFSSIPANALTRVWTGNGADNGLGTFGNWSPSGGVNDNDLVFDMADLEIQLDANDQSPNSILVKAEANNLRITTTTGKRLVIKDRITVEANTTAVFDVGISVYASVTDAFSYTVDVGEGGMLSFLRETGGYSKDGTFHKVGKGTLYLGGSTAGFQPGFSSHFEEGIVTMRSGTTLGAPTQGVNGYMTVYLGTDSTNATLNIDKVNSTRARIYGTLVTNGIGASRVETNTELFLTTGLDAKKGATFAFNLDDGGRIAGGTLELNDQVMLALSGGEIGQTYQLFDFDAVTGFDASKFTFQHDQFSNFAVQMENGVISVQVIPEPNVALLLGGSILVGGLLHRIRR